MGGEILLPLLKINILTQVYILHFCKNIKEISQGEIK